MVNVLIGTKAAELLLEAFDLPTKDIIDVKLGLDFNELCTIQITKAVTVEEWKSILKTLTETYYLVKKDDSNPPPIADRDAYQRLCWLYSSHSVATPDIPAVWDKGIANR